MSGSRFLTPRENWSDRERLDAVGDLARRLVTDHFTWTPPSIPANSTVDTVITTATSQAVTGVRSGAALVVTPPSSINAGVVVSGWAGDNAITIRLGNLTAAPIAPAAGVWAYLAAIQ